MRLFDKRVSFDTNFPSTVYMFIFLKTMVVSREKKVKDLLGEGQRWQ